MFHSIWLRFSTFWIILALGHSGLGQDSRGIGTLTLERKVSGQLTSAQSALYLIPAAPGKYLGAEFIISAAGLQVRWISPAGETLRDVPLPRTQQPVLLSFVTESSGDYRLELLSPMDLSSPLEYEVRLIEERATKSGDSLRLQAEERLLEGMRLQNQGSKEDIQKASQLYQEGIEIWVQLDSPADSTQARLKLCECNFLLGRLRDADKCLTDLLAIQEMTGDLAGMARTLVGLGATSYTLGKPSETVTFNRRAIDVSRQIDDTSQEAIALNTLALFYQDKGLIGEAIEAHEQSLALRRANQDVPGEANALNNIGTLHHENGDWQEALNHYFDALPILENWNQKNSNPNSLKTEASLLANIGQIYKELGHLERSASYYQRALSTVRKTSNPAVEGSVLGNLGVVMALEGDQQQADRLFQESLSLARKTRNRRLEGLALNRLADIEIQMRAYDKALKYSQTALEAHREVGNRRGEATALRMDGAALAGLERKLDAARQFEMASRISESIGDRPNLTLTLLLSANLERSRGNLEQAASKLDRSLAVVESLRMGLGSGQLRAEFLATRRQVYETYVDLLMQMEKPVQAFLIAEQAKARSLLDLLNPGREHRSKDIDPNRLARRAEVQEKLRFQARKRLALSERAHEPEEMKNLQKEVEQLAAEFEQLDSISPSQRPATLEVLSLQQMQELLPQGQADGVCRARSSTSLQYCSPQLKTKSGTRSWSSYLTGFFI